MVSAEPRGRILVVEDEEGIRRSLTTRLGLEGFSVLQAATGDEALRIVGADSPDLLLLDIRLPGSTNGYDVCRQLPRRTDAPDPPVIFLTALAEPEHEREGLALGAVDYLVKPFDMDVLVQKVCNHIATLRDQHLDAAVQLAEIGAMAAGVAHEINNPLSYLKGSLQVLRQSFEVLLAHVQTGDAPLPDGQVRPAVENIPRMLEYFELGAGQMERIVSSLILSSRTATAEPQPICCRLDQDLDALHWMVRFRSKSARPPKAVRLDVEQSDTPLYVHVDPLHLYQIAVNLCLNAVDAVGANGRVGLRFEDRGDCVALEVSDDGPGVRPEDRDRIFRRFHTTKPPGSGTGLGLSIARELARANGGDLALSDRPASGATFVLTLPPATEPAGSVEP